VNSNAIAVSYISSVKKQFRYYKSLADKAIAELNQEQFFSVEYAHLRSEELNSMAVLVKHVAGNMKSRWTDFYDTDGEKPWRNRDQEFIIGERSLKDLLSFWEEGWAVLFSVLDDLDGDKLEQTIYIRNMGHTVVEAINRQLMHYAYHIGQMVSIAKQWKGDEWKTLSVPRNSSEEYNNSKFSKPKRDEHFTDDL